VPPSPMAGFRNGDEVIVRYCVESRGIIHWNLRGGLREVERWQTFQRLRWLLLGLGSQVSCIAHMPRLAHEALGNKILKRIMCFRSIVLQQLKLKNLEPQGICKRLESVVLILKVFGKQAGWGIKCHALAHWQVLRIRMRRLWCHAQSVCVVLY